MIVAVPEGVDARDLKSLGLPHAGSIPAVRTTTKNPACAGPGKLLLKQVLVYASVVLSICQTTAPAAARNVAPTSKLSTRASLR